MAPQTLTDPSHRVRAYLAMHRWESRNLALGRWFVRRGHRGKEAPRELLGVLLSQLPDTLRVLRAHDQPGVVMLLHTVHNLGRVKARRVRIGRLRQAQNAARVACLRSWQDVGLLAQGSLPQCAPTRARG